MASLQFYLSNYATLAAADTAATTAGGVLLIDTSVTLTANTTLSSPVVYAAGGVISMSTFNLTISNALDGQDCQVINVGTGTLSITGGTVLKGIWLTGPYGNSSLDYAPALQQAFNIVFRAYNASFGPRVLDLEGASNFSGSGPSLFLNSGIQVPAGAWGGVVKHRGVVWQMNANNTPFFTFTAGSPNSDTEGWAFIGSTFSIFQWQTAQSNSNTLSVVFLMKQATGAVQNGHNRFVIDGAFVTNGWGFMSTHTGDSAFNGWWGCEIKNIGDAGVSGSLFYHQPPSGGAERQYYENIASINPNGQAPIFNLSAIQGLSINQCSFDSIGKNLSGTGGTTTPIIELSGCNDFKINEVHFEDCFTSLSFSGLIQVANSIGAIDGIVCVNWTTTASSTQGLVRLSVAGTKVSVDNVYTSGTTVGTSGSAYGVIVPSSGAILTGVVGQKWSLDASFAGVTIPFAANHPEQIVYSGEVTASAFYGNSVDTFTSETDLTVGGSNIAGDLMWTNASVTRVVFKLSAAITAGSLVLRVYDQATNRSGSLTLSAPAQSGIIAFPPVFPSGSAWALTLGNDVRVTAQASSLTPTAMNLQVKVGYLPQG